MRRAEAVGVVDLGRLIRVPEKKRGCPEVQKRILSFPILLYLFHLNILSIILGIQPITTVNNSSLETGNGDFSDLPNFLIFSSHILYFYLAC